MPLSDHEQHILDEIERRLAEEDPRLVEQVTRTTLSSHLARRLRLALLGFSAGFVLSFFFFVSLELAVAGFFAMVFSALLIARYVKQLGSDQVRALQEEGRFSVGGIIGRIAARFRRAPEPPDS